MGYESLNGSYCYVNNGQMIVKGFDVPVIVNNAAQENKREIVLLMTKKQIMKWDKMSDNTGMTIVPLEVFHHHDYFKMKVAFVKGRKEYDKREVLKKRDADKDMKNIKNIKNLMR